MNSSEFQCKCQMICDLFSLMENVGDCGDIEHVWAVLESRRRKHGNDDGKQLFFGLRRSTAGRHQPHRWWRCPP